MIDLESRLNSIPAFPESLLKLMKLVNSEDSDISEISKFIEKDQTLSLKVLRLANSPYYNRGLEIKSIRQATVFLGIETIKEIVFSTTIIKNLNVKIGQNFYDLGMFWKHSVATGYIAKWLSRELKIGNPEEAYSLGLLHDYGKIAFILLETELYRKVIETVKKTGKDYLNVEKMIFGLTHSEFGGEVAKRWNLPKVYEEVMRFHHKMVDGLENDTMVALVGFSNDFSKQLGFYFPWEYGKLVLSENPFWNYLLEKVKGLDEIDEVLFTLKMEEQSVRIEKLVNEALEE